MKEGAGARRSEIAKKTTQAISERDSESLKNAFAEFKCMWFSVRLENTDMRVCLLYDALKNVFSSLGLNIDSNSTPDDIDFSGVSATFSSSSEEIN